MYIPPQPVEVDLGESRVEFQWASAQHSTNGLSSEQTSLQPDVLAADGERRNALGLVSSDIRDSIRLPNQPSVGALVGLGLPKEMKLAFNRLSRAVSGNMRTLAPAWRMILALNKEEPHLQLDDIVEAYEDLYIQSYKNPKLANALFSDLGDVAQLYPTLSPAEISKVYAGLFELHDMDRASALQSLEFLLLRADENPDVPLILLGMSYTGLFALQKEQGKTFQALDVLLESHRSYGDVPFPELAIKFEKLLQISDIELSSVKEHLRATF